MRLTLITILLSITACASVPDSRPTQEVPEYCTSGETDPPIDCECYVDGKFDENLGHDTLDCGNL